jgi:transglutaminase-like putative cysteine protease
MKKFIFLLAMLLLPICAHAAAIDNPQVVDMMKVSIVENGSIETSGAVSSLQLNISIPQGDANQVIENLAVEDSSGPCKTSLCSYSFMNDSYGNRIINIVWTSPPVNVVYKVSSTVRVTRRQDIEKRIISDFIQPTSLVQSSNSRIVSLASDARGTDFEKVSYLAKWIGDNIEYDKVYSDVSLSATQILDLRKGVCKEFSNLLVSFLRDLGYYSAVTVGYVYPGRVYETNDFQPHGWAEVYADNGIVVDPVWGEVGYLDATHIKFATLPDSSWTFVSANANGLGDIKIKIGQSSVKISVVDFTESPLINVTTKLLANSVWSNYSVLRTDMSAKGCFMTRIEYKSCIDDSGKEFLTAIDPQNIVYFCNNKTIFTIFKMPPLDDRKNYRCDIRIFPYAGEETSEQLVLNPKGYGYSKLVVEKNVLIPGEKFNISARNSHIFTDDGQYGYEKAQFTAPGYDFKVYSYNSGYLDVKNITVVMNKPIDVSIDSNDTATVGSPLAVRVKVDNLMKEPQQVKVIFKGNSISDTVANSTYFYFNFTPQGTADNLLQVFASTSDFSTSASKEIVVSPQNNIASSVFDGIGGFFAWLLNLIRSIRI